MSLLLCLLLLPAASVGHGVDGGVSNDGGGCGPDAYALIDLDTCSWTNEREVGFELVNKSCAAAVFASKVSCSWVPLASQCSLRCVALCVSQDK